MKTKKDCCKCKFKCSLNISEKDRSDIFKEFWSINDNEKMNFFAKTTTQETKKSPRRGPSSRRHRSLTYCLPVNDQNVRVCKMFYLTTLDINHKRVCTYHNSKHTMGGTPEHLKWGKSANNVVPQEIKDGIRVHINSIPRVESHYCRATTNKEYVAPGFYISLLYEKYVEKCNETGWTPGKIHIYRQIFNSEFNIAFHVPKKDRCDVCEAIKVNKEPTDEEKKSTRGTFEGQVGNKN